MFVFAASGKHQSPPMMKASSSLISQPSHISSILPETHEHQQQPHVVVVSPHPHDIATTEFPPPLPYQFMAGPPTLPGFPMMKSSSASNIRRKARKYVASQPVVPEDNHNNTTTTTNPTKDKKRKRRYGHQALELERFKHENAALIKKLASTEKRCTFLADSRKELRAVAETNHFSAVRAESSASRHSSISSTLAVKYKNVQKVLNLVREEYDTMVQETEEKRANDLQLAGSIDEIASNIRQVIVYDTVCILKLFALMDLNGDGDLERHEIVKAITFRKEVKNLISTNPRITVALKPEKIAKAMKKMDKDGDQKINREEFLQFTLDRIADGSMCDAPNHVKAMVKAEGGLNGGGSQIFEMGSTSGGLSSFGSMPSSSMGNRGSSGSLFGSKNKKHKESSRTAEKAYKNNLMLLLREKNTLEREYRTLQVVHRRGEKRILDLEAKVTKGLGEIKRLRTMYKTSQKQIEKGLKQHQLLKEKRLETKNEKEKKKRIQKKQYAIK